MHHLPRSCCLNAGSRIAHRPKQCLTLVPAATAARPTRNVFYAYKWTALAPERRLKCAAARTVQGQSTNADAQHQAEQALWQIVGGSAMGAANESALEPYAGPVAVYAVPGAGLGMYTTEAVLAGQLLITSQPLATVSLPAAQTAAGPSRLIHTLLQQLFNPGQAQWLQLLIERDFLAHEQLYLQGGQAADYSVDVAVENSSKAGWPSAIDISKLQSATSAGGKLERLQMTPIQLADVVQQCAYTLGRSELQITQQLLEAASHAAGPATAATAAAAAQSGPEGEACCGLWPELALMGRSCAPNVSVTLVGEGVLLLRAAMDLPAGTQLVISQLQPTSQLLRPAEQRQQLLKQYSGLSCTCGRCNAEAQLIKQHPRLQQLMQDLTATAAAAAAALGSGSTANDTSQHQQQGNRRAGGLPKQPYWQQRISNRHGEQILESAGGNDSTEGGYSGDDWLYQRDQPDPQYDYEPSSSSRSNGNVVIAAEFVPLSGNNGASNGYGNGSNQQQQYMYASKEVALEWLQRLVVDLLELHQQAAVVTDDQHVLLSAACHSSWAAVTKALVILASSNNSSSNGSSSSSEGLLAEQLHYLLDHVPVQGSNSGSSTQASWQQLLLRSYDLEVQTLEALVPGSIDHVMSAAGAAAVAADMSSESGQGFGQGFNGAAHAAAVAKFGQHFAEQQGFMAACGVLAAVAAGLSPRDAAAAATAISGNRTSAAATATLAAPDTQDARSSSASSTAYGGSSSVDYNASSSTSNNGSRGSRDAAGTLQPEVSSADCQDSYKAAASSNGGAASSYDGAGYDYVTDSDITALGLGLDSVDAAETAAESPTAVRPADATDCEVVVEIDGAGASGVSNGSSSNSSSSCGSSHGSYGSSNGNNSSEYDSSSSKWAEEQSVAWAREGGGVPESEAGQTVSAFVQQLQQRQQQNQQERWQRHHHHQQQAQQQWQERQQQQQQWQEVAAAESQPWQRGVPPAWIKIDSSGSNSDDNSLYDSSSSMKTSGGSNGGSTDGSRDSGSSGFKQAAYSAVGNSTPRKSAYFRTSSYGGDDFELLSAQQSNAQTGSQQAQQQQQQRQQGQEQSQDSELRRMWLRNASGNEQQSAGTMTGQQQQQQQQQEEEQELQVESSSTGMRFQAQIKNRLAGEESVSKRDNAPMTTDATGDAAAAEPVVPTGPIVASDSSRATATGYGITTGYDKITIIVDRTDADTTGTDAQDEGANRGSSSPSQQIEVSSLAAINVQGQEQGSMAAAQHEGEGHITSIMECDAGAESAAAGATTANLEEGFGATATTEGAVASFAKSVKAAGISGQDLHTVATEITAGYPAQEAALQAVKAEAELAAATATASSSIIIADSSRSGLALPGNQPLPAEASVRLNKLLEWTIEVSGPLTESQHALVNCIISGSNGSNNAQHQEEQQGIDAQTDQVFDPDQVHLLRQLLGLV